MTAIHDTNSSLATAPVLYISLELGWTTWKLAFTIGLGEMQGKSSVSRHAAILAAPEPMKMD